MCGHLSISRGVPGTALAQGHPASPATAQEVPCSPPKSAPYLLPRLSAAPRGCCGSGPSPNAPSPAPFRAGGGAACQAGLEVEGRTGVTGLTCNSCLTEPGLLVQQGAPSPRAFISVSASKICDLSPPSQGEFCSIVCFQKQKLCNFQSRCVCGQLISISSCARLVLV